MLISEFARRASAAIAAEKAAEARVEKARKALEAATEEYHEQHNESRKEYSSAAHEAITAWLRNKLHGKSIKEQQALADELGGLAHNPCPKRHYTRDQITGDVVVIYNNEDRLRKLGHEAFGEHIVSFCEREQPPDEDELGRLAHRLMAAYLESVLVREFVAVAQVSRPQPKDDERFEKRMERERAWCALIRKTPTRFLVDAVYHELIEANRIKRSAPAWKEASGCAWSFRNPATVDGDIARAVSSASGVDFKQAA